MRYLVLLDTTCTYNHALGDAQDDTSADVLDMHARLQADTAKVLSPEIHERWKSTFEDFVTQLETSGATLPGMKRACSLTAAYGRYWMGCGYLRL